MAAPFVCVYASQLAACIGAHRHKKPHEALEAMWQRIDPAGFRGAMARNGVTSAEEAARAAIEANAHLRDLVEAASRAPDTSAEVADRYERASRSLASLAEGQDLEANDGILRHEAYTAYGTAREARVMERVRDMGIACREDPKFHKKAEGQLPLPGGGECPWYIGGRVDAVSDDRTLVIEIKNRVNRLFYRVPEYERVQVQAYMHLLDIDRAMLVECLTLPPGEPDREPDMHLHVTHIPRDRPYWERDVAPRLRAFVEFLAVALHDTGVQDRYMRSKRRSAMIRAHVTAPGPHTCPAAGQPPPATGQEAATSTRA